MTAREPGLVPRPAEVAWTGDFFPREQLEGGVVERELPAAELGPEGYTLEINAQGAVLSGTPAGLRLARATLRQLLEQCGPQVPGVSIRDFPRFPYRGLMLDVSRHFLSVPDLKVLLRELSALKFNTFHWHLTDDQGWRLEIKRYPRLTEVGGWRARTLVGHARETPARFDQTRHGGFYTQEDVREVVAYAAELGLTVIPEIDLPGHVQAMLAAYPHLSCTGEALEVWDRWGINKEVLCSREATFEFLEGVMEEVLDLFPSRTVHIGGDEVETDHWATCPDCQAVMRREGFTEEGQLRAYFVERMAAFLHGRGARVIGWNELTELELPPGVQIMSWRGFEGGVNAARRGFEVIMCPQSHVYLDWAQGETPPEPLAIRSGGTVQHTYSFEPVPPELTPAEAERVIGGQANLWREYIPTTEHLQYMLFPRLHAVAEVLWSPRESRDWLDFWRRLARVLPGLEGRGIRYRPLDQD